MKNKEVILQRMNIQNQNEAHMQIGDFDHVNQFGILRYSNNIKQFHGKEKS